MINAFALFVKFDNISFPLAKYALLGTNHQHAYICQKVRTVRAIKRYHRGLTMQDGYSYPSSTEWELQCPSDPPSDIEDVRVDHSNMTTPLKQLNSSFDVSRANVGAQNRCDYSSESLTDGIFSSRRAQYRENFPAYSSSPTRSHKKQQEERKQHIENIRSIKLDDRVMDRRGGLDNMEKFVMIGEHLQEVNQLKLQAQQHVIPPELAETLEKEQQEDLEDDELMEFIDRKEKWDKELEQVLSELSIT